jgi:hypothetical protein
VCFHESKEYEFMPNARDWKALYRRALWTEESSQHLAPLLEAEERPESEMPIPVH